MENHAHNYTKQWPHQKNTCPCPENDRSDAENYRHPEKACFEGEKESHLKTCDSSVNKYRKNHLQEQQQKSSNRIRKVGNCCKEERNCHHYSEIRKEIREVQGYREVTALKRII